MKCPHCHAEISDSMTSCPYCGQSTSAAASQQNYATAYSAAQPTQQPNPQNTQTATQPNQQTAQGAMPYYYAQTPNYTTMNGNVSVKKGKTGGEIAAIVIAIVVSVFSVIAALIIFVVYVEKWSENTNDYDFNDDTSSSYFGDYDFGDYGEYGIDGFDDEDSLENFFDAYGYGDYYNSIFGSKSQYPASSPAAEHTPIEVQDYLYSFSDGSVTTTYTVELDEVYRGEAALKLLDGARLPTIDSTQEVYLAKFKVTVTDQETEAYVNPAPSMFTAAYKGEGDGSSSDQYTTLSSLKYKNANKLIKKGESDEFWMAFLVDKSDERPLIMWDKYESNYFRYSKAAVSSAAGLEAGAALEEESAVSSNS